MTRTQITSAAALLLTAATLLAAPPASDNDKAFEAKVSQGGMYEVEAGKLAATRAHAQHVKDFAVMEVHDHTLVGDQLKRISVAAGLSFPNSLNPEFAARLEKLKAVPADHFDAAYLADMKQIHDNDEKLFAQEAQDGSAQFKPFATETALIVKGHLGTLSVY